MRQDLKNVFILGAPVYMVANSTITVLSSITNIHPPPPSQSYFRMLSHILCSSPIKKTVHSSFTPTSSPTVYSSILLLCSVGERGGFLF
jgi:hypothetical protein